MLHTIMTHDTTAIHDIDATHYNDTHYYRYMTLDPIFIHTIAMLHTRMTHDTAAIHEIDATHYNDTHYWRSPFEHPALDLCPPLCGEIKRKSERTLDICVDK